MADLITVAKARQRLGLAAAANHRDEEIADLIKAATEHVEDLSGHLLSRRAVQARLSIGQDGIARIHAWPDPVVDLVAYQDANGIDRELAGDGLRVDLAGRPGLIYANEGTWPGDYSRAGVATVTAGYATLEAIPPKLVQAVLVLVGQWFEDPAGAREVSPHVKAMCQSFRTF